MRVFLDANIVLDVLMNRPGLCAADWIITRNVADFTKSRISVLTPAEFLARYPAP